MTDKSKHLQLTDEQTQIVLEILGRFFPKKDIWAYGSRTDSSKVKPFSDLDLAIVATTSLSADLMGRAQEAFTSSELPFRVELVCFTDLPAQMQDHIRKHHVVMQ